MRSETARVLIVKQSLALGVAALAEADQIVERVRSAPITTERAPRHNVVYVQQRELLNEAAVLAGVGVSDAGEAGVLGPVGAEQRAVTAAVSGAVANVRADMLIPARRRAEAPCVPVRDGERVTQLKSSRALAALLRFAGLPSRRIWHTALRSRNRFAVLLRVGPRHTFSRGGIALVRTVLPGGAAHGKGLIAALTCLGPLPTGCRKALARTEEAAVGLRRIRGLNEKRPAARAANPVNQHALIVAPGVPRGE